MRSKEFLNYLKHEKRYSEKTILSYRGDVTQFYDYIEQHISLENGATVTTREVRAWVVHLLNKEQLAPTTIRRKISALNTYFNWMLRKNLIKKNPAKSITPLKLPKRNPEYVTQLSIDKMFQNLKQLDESLEGNRTRLIIELLYNTGIRRQELIDLKWSGFDASRKVIQVTGKGNKDRQIPVSEYLIKELKAFKSICDQTFEGTTEYIFVSNKGKKLYPKFVYEIVKAQLTKYSSIAKRSPHVLRHTFATHLLNNGADLNDIKELLGHSSLAATQVYTHNSIEELKTIYKQAHPKAK